jgi:callose synthase
MIVTGGPLFFMFHMGTKSHYFEQTLLAGGAMYRPTGRGFVTRYYLLILCSHDSLMMMTTM